MSLPHFSQTKQNFYKYLNDLDPSIDFDRRKNAPDLTEILILNVFIDVRAILDSMLKFQMKNCDTR